MKTRFNKREVQRSLGAKPRRSQKQVRQDLTTRDRGAMDGAATPGQNAGDQRTNRQVAVDHHRTSGGQRIKAHRGSGHVQRLDGKGARPTSGRLPDHWSGRPTISPADRLAGVHRDYYEGQARHGAEWNLLQDAQEHALGLETARSRAAILKRAAELTAAGSPVAEKVREALIG